MADLHFTYTSEVEPDLCQGDVIGRTSEVDELLKTVHPYFDKRKSDYHYLMVLTQSCELALRPDNRCNSPYVTVCAVRPAVQAVERYSLGQLSSQVDQRFKICDERLRNRINMFLDRLLNNNESEYFFLHSEPQVDLNRHYCAFLQVSIALKAAEHYEKLRSARVVSLTEPFRNKLGYLVGNSYLKIGTDDLTERLEREQVKTVRGDLQGGHTGIQFLPSNVYKALVDKLDEWKSSEVDGLLLKKLIQESVKETRAQAKKLRVLGVVDQALERFDIDGEKAERIRTFLENNPTFSAAFTGK